MGRDQGKRDKWVVVIGILKLLKGASLVIVAVGLLKLLHKDVAQEMTRWIDRLNVDPDNHYLRELLKHVAGLDTRKVAFASVGTFFYASLFLTEGTGLL